MIQQNRRAIRGERLKDRCIRAKTLAEDFDGVDCIFCYGAISPKSNRPDGECLKCRAYYKSGFADSLRKGK